MKEINLNYAKFDFNENVFSHGKTVARSWTDELIKAELEELLKEDDKTKTVQLDCFFPVNNYTVEEIEDTLSIYGEITEITDEFISVTWMMSVE